MFNACKTSIGFSRVYILCHEGDHTLEHEHVHGVNATVTICKMHTIHI